MKALRAILFVVAVLSGVMVLLSIPSNMLVLAQYFDFLLKYGFVACVLFAFSSPVRCWKEGVPIGEDLLFRIGLWGSFICGAGVLLLDKLQSTL